MQQEALVSIIVNNYNYSRYLREAIDSALGQTYPHVEVIVVDDGSTDDSRDIITSYGERITPIFKPNGGQASALNIGFAHSHGSVIFFLDADDVLTPTIAQRAAEIFQSSPETAKVQYRLEVIDGASVRTGVLKPQDYVPLLSGDLRRHYMTFPDDIMRMATSGNVFPAWVLKRIFPIPEQGYRGGADTYLTHISPLFGPVLSLQEVGAYYRVHSSNNYEVSVLNLNRIRRNVTHARQTHGYIKAFAERLGLYGKSKPKDILSVSYIINRAISLKLEPAQHPIKGDRMLGLFFLGIIAAWRRFDISISMKALFILWFAAMVLAPRQAARWLSEKMVLPDTRKQLNKLLGVMYRRLTGNRGSGAVSNEVRS